MDLLRGRFAVWFLAFALLLPTGCGEGLTGELSPEGAEEEGGEEEEDEEED